MSLGFDDLDEDALCAAAAAASPSAAKRRRQEEPRQYSDAALPPPHCLSGPFPTASLFKKYQNAAMAILDKGDCTTISGRPYIKKTGWRKIAFYFNVCFEIKDKVIEFDENRNVQRAEFTVRAYMQGGRFSDGWGSCERREKKFLKPNHDIPSTAETRAKNRASQALENTILMFDLVRHTQSIAKRPYEYCKSDDEKSHALVSTFDYGWND